MRQIQGIRDISKKVEDSASDHRLEPDGRHSGQCKQIDHEAEFEQGKDRQQTQRCIQLGMPDPFLFGQRHIDTHQEYRRPVKEIVVPLDEPGKEEQQKAGKPSPGLSGSEKLKSQREQQVELEFDGQGPENNTEPAIAAERDEITHVQGYLLPGHGHAGMMFRSRAYQKEQYGKYNDQQVGRLDANDPL